MSLSGSPVELTNWSKSARSPCYLYKVKDSAGIATALAAARAQNLSVIPHGAGHSYTDAAFNTGGVVIDLTPMRRILSWDAEHGIMRVEPGVTLRDVVQTAWKDGWWPPVSPSTPDVTIGGCAAMNVNGRNAWNAGPFGAFVLSLDVQFPTGEICTFDPHRDSALFNALIGSMGLLGFILAVTIQLQRLTTGYVDVRRQRAASLEELFAYFAAEEGRSDFMEAWLDGFATGDQLGRGHLTSAVMSDRAGRCTVPTTADGWADRFERPFFRLAATLGQPLIQPGVRFLNRVNDWHGGSISKIARHQVSLYPYTFWSPWAFAGYHALFSQGVETFQAFVPADIAQPVFASVLKYSQQQGCLPIWCVIKKHRSDPSLLSYQLDGFSMELNYQRTVQTTETLKRVLQTMIAMVIEAGGKFYFAKDHFLTQAQYRRSVGGETVDTFMAFKQRFDPQGLLQSDLFRRVFQPSKY